MPPSLPTTAVLPSNYGEESGTTTTITPVNIMAVPPMPGSTSEIPSMLWQTREGMSAPTDIPGPTAAVLPSNYVTAPGGTRLIPVVISAGPPRPGSKSESPTFIWQADTTFRIISALPAVAALPSIYATGTQPVDIVSIMKCHAIPNNIPAKLGITSDTPTRNSEFGLGGRAVVDTV